MTGEVIQAQTQEQSRLDTLLNYGRNIGAVALTSLAALVGANTLKADPVEASPVDLVNAPEFIEKSDISAATNATFNNSNATVKSITFAYRTFQSASSEEQERKQAKLEKKCPYSVNLAPGKPGGKGKRNNKKPISGRVLFREDDKNIFKFYLQDAKYCGMLVVHYDYSISFPRPTKIGKSSGYYKDKFGHDSKKGVQAIIFYAKPIN